MRYSTKLIGTALVLAAVTACGNPAGMAAAPASGGPSTAPASPTSSPAKPQFTAPPGSTPVPFAQVDSTALPKTFPREVYSDKGGTVLWVRAEEGGCGHALGAAAVQDSQRVVVDLSETKAQTGQMCTMDLRHPVISVPLAAPLGERTVVLKQSPPR
ncbi:DUF3558 domain-containing protein [Amycolatopsis jejuensis]|uniref:DUF3558 domain-containing protein n=1 Tax=Amycolatopsis jejuensis TaxID=330084 RepID=UPI001FDF7D3E|nr:DUF3558 domain-containing protein [Amycolatopsis jejuensis]